MHFRKYAYQQDRIDPQILEAREIEAHEKHLDYNL